MSTMQIVWVSLAGALMLAWLLLAVFGPRKVQTPGTLLRYGAFGRTFALVLALATAMIMLYMMGAFPWGQNQARMNVAGICFVGFSLSAGLLLIEVTRMQIVVNEEGVTSHSPWSGTAILKWIEVERVGYSALNRWFVVYGAGRTIRVSRSLSDIGAFVAAVRRHVAPERCASAAAVLDALK